MYFTTHVHPKSYDELEMVETVKLEANQWYILNARAIHSVENMTSPRISIQAALPLRSEFVKKYFDINLTDPDSYIHNNWGK
jgi:hypothetical protein